MVHMIALARKLQPNHEWESERNKGDDRVDKIKDSLLKKGFVFSEPKQIECGRKDNFINTHNIIEDLFQIKRWIYNNLFNKNESDK